MAKKINISGEIGWDVIPSDVAAQFKAAKGEDVDIHIASPGGYVYEGIEIYNLIRDYKRENPNAQIMIILKGLAASMASYIACNPAADMVVAEDNAVFMIHNAWSYARGDYNELMKTAETLHGLDKMLNKAYAKKTGKSEEDVTAMMDAETWFFGEEIKEAGFIDDIIATESDDKDKASLVAAGKMKFKALHEKMKESEKAKDDIDKAAAIIRPNNRTEQNNNTPAAGGQNSQEVQMKTLAELRDKFPALHEDAVALGRKKEKEEAAAERERGRVPAIIKMKQQFRDSPLSSGINEICDEALEKEWTEEQTVMEIAKWTTSDTVIASIESPGPIATRKAGASASGEVFEDMPESIWEEED